MQSEKETVVSNLKSYLLGTLPATEIETLDLQVISGEIPEEQLLWAESELIEDYLDKTLAPSEMQSFRERFFASPERVARIKQISMLKNYVRNRAAMEKPAKIAETLEESFPAKIKKFFFLDWRFAVAVFSLLVVGIFAAVYLTGNRQTAAEKEFAALNQNDLSDLARLEPMTSLSLTSGGVFRDAGSVRKLTEKQLTDKILFRLVVPLQKNPTNKFKAELISNAQTLFTQTRLPSYNNADGQEIRLVLPSSALKKGTYQIKLTSESTPDSAFVYHFAVE